MKAERVKELTEKITKRIIDTLGDRVDLIVLFGSVARGESQPLSDIDIGVRTGAPHEQWSEIQLDLLGLFDMSKDPAIDVVLLNETSLTLEFRAIRDGRVLFERRPGLWEEYVEFVLQRYPDWATYIDRYLRESVGV
ncbi:MAG: type VII toxin-antitoxin system MntA family adenylyltransferase antitoxin [Candidatus Thorarchaeota archaeon]